jgi:2-polyprenyl-3-methyl-5-hydroxy-6-metoxy-1,4-benzoquinol methylase
MSASEGYHRGLLTTFIERWRLRKAAQHIKTGDSVLDLACNEGKLIEFLPPQTDYLGIDISANAISNAQRHYPDRKFLVADLTEVTPTLNMRFDVIVMLAFLEHVATPGMIVSQVATLLKPGGTNCSHNACSLGASDS